MLACLHRQLYKGYRADSDKQLHADMVGETHKVARAAQAAADADTPLKAAVSLFQVFECL